MPRKRKKRSAFLTVAEAAEEIGVTPRTIRNWIEKGAFDGKVTWNKETGWWRARTNEFQAWLREDPSRSRR